MPKLACCEEITKEQRSSFSQKISMLVFLKSSSGTRTSPPVPSHTGYEKPDDLREIKRKKPPPPQIAICTASYFSIYFFFLVKTHYLEPHHTPIFSHSVYGKMGWKVRDRTPVATRFSARPDRPWGPLSLLYDGYRFFPGGKVRPGRAADHSPPF